MGILFICSCIHVSWIFEPSVYEPRHDKTNKKAVCQAKIQISQSDQSLRCPHEEALGP